MSNTKLNINELVVFNDHEKVSKFVFDPNNLLNIHSIPLENVQLTIQGTGNSSERVNVGNNAVFLSETEQFQNITYFNLLPNFFHQQRNEQTVPLILDNVQDLTIIAGNKKVIKDKSKNNEAVRKFRIRQKEEIKTLKEDFIKIQRENELLNNDRRRLAQHAKRLQSEKEILQNSYNIAVKQNQRLREENDNIRKQMEEMNSLNDRLTLMLRDCMKE